MTVNWKIVSIVLIPITIFLLILLIGYGAGYEVIKEKHNQCMFILSNCLNKLSNLKNQYEHGLNKLEIAINDLKKDLEKFAEIENLRVFTSFDDYVTKLAILLTYEDFEQAYRFMIRNIVLTKSMGDWLRIYELIREKFGRCPDSEHVYVKIVPGKVIVIGNKTIEIPRVITKLVSEFIKLPREFITGVYKCGDCDDINLLAYVMVYTYINWYLPYGSKYYKLYLADWVDEVKNEGHVFVIVQEKLSSTILILDPAGGYLTTYPGTSSPLFRGPELEIPDYVKYWVKRGLTPTKFKLVILELRDGNVIPYIVFEGDTEELIYFLKISGRVE